MRNSRLRQHHGILRFVSLTALALTSMMALPQAASAQIAPPSVPDHLKVLPPNTVYLVGHGVGSQNYVCAPKGTGVDWSLFTPEATLFSSQLDQVTSHFFSPNPDDNGFITPTWVSSKDSSTVWAKGIDTATFDTDPLFVSPTAIAWVSLKEAGVRPGPTGGDKLTKTTFIQRVNTVGGLAPQLGCTQGSDLGKRAFIPYEADYFFYRDPTVR